MQLAPPRAILFDWDDTLVENWDAIHAAMNATLAAMGRPSWSPEQTRAQAVRSLRDSFPGLFGERWAEARDIFYGHFRANHLAGLAPRPGAGASLARLAADGLFLAVVSNKTGALLRREVAHLGWGPLFGAVVGAGDASADKPAAAPVALALAASGVAPGPAVWLVGDGRSDIECARAAACAAVLLRQEPPGPEEFGRLAPDRHVRDFAELLALVAAS